MGILQRAVQAALAAGFKQVSFELEPIAAAFDYERRIEADTLALPAVDRLAYEASATEQEIVAGALAVALWEPVTVGFMLDGGFGEYAWGVTLGGMFVLLLLINGLQAWTAKRTGRDR